MAKVTDEMLMAYADGALSALERAKVKAVLETDPAARHRVQIFRATGAPLSELYEKPMTDPVPSHLKDFILNYPLAADRPQPARRETRSSAWLSGILGWLSTPAPAARWQLAAASAALLTIGAGTASFFLSKATTNDLIAFHDGHIYAEGALENVLNREPSERETRIGGVRGAAVTMRVSLTFKSKQDTYCREYEIAAPGNSSFAGLGCRDRAGHWAIEVHLPSENRASNGTKAAGRDNPALDTIVDRMIDGDAFGPEEENAAIKTGWK